MRTLGRAALALAAVLSFLLLATGREAYANDLGDSHTLVGVTASLNRSKGDHDVAEWLPPINDCRYIKDRVTAKI